MHKQRATCIHRKSGQHAPPPPQFRRSEALLIIAAAGCQHQKTTRQVEPMSTIQAERAPALTCKAWLPPACALSKSRLHHNAGQAAFPLQQLRASLLPWFPAGASPRAASGGGRACACKAMECETGLVYARRQGTLRGLILGCRESAHCGPAASIGRYKACLRQSCR